MWSKLCVVWRNGGVDTGTDSVPNLSGLPAIVCGGGSGEESLTRRNEDTKNDAENVFKVLELNMGQFVRGSAGASPLLYKCAAPWIGKLISQQDHFREPLT